MYNNLPCIYMRGCNPNMRLNPRLPELLIEAMKDERADRAKYKGMMEAAPNEKVRQQVEFAFEDEGKHYKMFQQIYRKITGESIEIPLPNVPRPTRYLDAIESSINGELEAVELYRTIRAMLPTRELRDMLYEIITDEQEHATRFTYLYAMNK